MNDRQRLVGLALALVLIAGAVVAIEKPWDDSVSRVPRAPDDLPQELARYPAAADFGGATGWVNSEPLDLVDLRGQVVLVDFWTYSCINCIHTFPHLVEWHDRYKDDGLVIVGVHTPEFRFERQRANVQGAADRYGLEYPIAQDNDYDIWKAYHNRYWPAEYLVDHYGRIRYTHFGEGSYDRTEEAIRDLLEEAGHAPSGSASGMENRNERSGSITPELYAAAAQGEDRVAIGNPEGYHPGETVAYARPAEDDVTRDRIFLVGRWSETRENVTAAENASILVRFRAGGANLVADSATGNCAEALLDGAAWPPDLAAADLTFQGDRACLHVDGPRSYDVYAGPLEEHVLELRVPAGFTLWTFAFSYVGNEVTP